LTGGRVGGGHIIGVGARRLARRSQRAADELPTAQDSTTRRVMVARFLDARREP
jgi:hypothetical protein